jgi:hypothetical protein
VSVQPKDGLSPRAGVARAADARVRVGACAALLGLALSFSGGVSAAGSLHRPYRRLEAELPLTITEIMYHPAAGGAEFVELANSGQRAVTLGGVRFSDGIDYTFPAGFTLAPGERALVTSSIHDMAAAYPGVEVAGEYGGRLDNAGETLTLRYPSGQVLLSLTYDDDLPWPTGADGLGYSLVLRTLTSDPADPWSWCASSALGGSPGAPEPAPCPQRDDPTDALFDPEHLLEVAIQLDPADWDALRRQERNLLALFAGTDCLAAPFESPFTDFPAHVTVDGVALEPVALRKKGFLGSLSRERPSLKLRFDKYLTGQRLSGLRWLTLNNCLQDLSVVRQCLGYKLFAAAGVPAPRCGFAAVTVNGEALGVYANVETVRERFLARNFAENGGPLWEGTLSDFRPEFVATFESQSGKDDPARLDAMVAALEVPDDQLLASLEPLVDVDAFIDFWAMEVLIGHWDGYAGNTNNFLVYDDPASGLLHFIPWGADLILRDRGSLSGVADAPAVLAAGMLARRLYLYPPTRAAYVGRVLELLDTVWDEDAILGDIDRWSGVIRPRLAPSQVTDFDAALESVRMFVQTRQQQVVAALVPQPPEWTEPLQAPVCFPAIGQLAASFQTSWGSLEDDPFQAGASLTAIAIGAQQVPILAGGAIAGPGEIPGEQAVVAVMGLLADWTLAIAVVQTTPEQIAAGSVIDLERAPNLGMLLHFDPASGLSPQLVGLLAAGSLRLDVGSTVAGSPIAGSLQATIYESRF